MRRIGSASRGLGSGVMHFATDYPSVSHTFIADEVAQLRELGLRVETSAINPPTAESTVTARDQDAAATTYYIKAAGTARGALSCAALLARHPVTMLRAASAVLRIDPLDLPVQRKRMLQFGEAMLLWRHCSRRGISAIHAHFGQAAATIAWFAATIGTTVDGRRWTWSVTIHGWNEFVAEDRAQLAHKLAAADLVVGISDYTRSQLLRLSERSTWPKIHVVRCGIDLDRLRFVEHPPPVGDPVILVTARLSKEKGHLVLLEAAARLRSDQVSPALRFVGPGHLGAAILQTAEQLGLADSVQLLGALSPKEVREELARADVFCLPTFAEGLPVSIMEAMAVGVPVVTTYISGIPELVTDGVTGYVVPAARADLLADALIAALQPGPRRAEVIAAARRRVVEQHDIRTNAAQLLQLLCQAHGLTPHRLET
jgi:glycosyltransferase involved in cell wall biosynthesis